MKNFASNYLNKKPYLFRELLKASIYSLLIASILYLVLWRLAEDFLPPKYLDAILSGGYISVTDIVVVLICLLSFAISFYYFCRERLHYLYSIHDSIKILESGDLDYKVPEIGDDELCYIAKSLNKMSTNLKDNIESEKMAIHANNSLVTALSHDLRTPLTAQIGYLEILSQKHYHSDEEMEKYLQKCLDNGYEIKYLSDRLFEYFLAYDRSTDSLQKMEKMDGLETLMQLITDHTVFLEDQGFHFSINEPELCFFISVNIDDMKRIFDNIFSNVEKYADSSDPVLISITVSKKECSIEIKNRIADKPRKNESSKVGLVALKALCNRQNGKFVYQSIDNYFSVEFSLPISSL